MYIGGILTWQKLNILRQQLVGFLFSVYWQYWSLFLFICERAKVKGLFEVELNQNNLKVQLCFVVYSYLIYDSNLHIKMLYSDDFMS